MTTHSASVPSTLELLFNHVALPPRLPGKEDHRIEEVQCALTAGLLNASRELRDLVYKDYGDQWDSIYRSLQICKNMNAGGRLNKATLVTQFQALARKSLLILHVTEQNAGLLIRRHHDDQGESVIFEAFEASAISEKVLASENALQWDFPGSAIAVPFTEFSNSSFQNSLAGFLDQASTESIKRFAARTNKAGSFAFECRDTVDPALITQMLMTLLEANGHRVFPPLLRKRVRDDVCWNDGAEKPWRRCPFWLVLRVGVQKHLYAVFGAEMGRVHYKFFICLVLTRLIDETLDHVSPELVAFLKAKLCRRLVKLEVDKDQASSSVRHVYIYMFTTLESLFNKTTKRANKDIELAWTTFQKTIRRPIPYLPRYAEKQDQHLKLPNSGAYLQEILDQPLHEDGRSPNSALYRFSVDHDKVPSTNRKMRAFANRYYSLSEIEEEGYLPAPTLESSCEVQCIKLAGKIDNYIGAVGSSYDFNSEQKSTMLLTVMELWMSMDECANKLFDLLKDYDPGFPSEMLDILQLPCVQDMYRLQRIQLYLQGRRETCNYSRMTIFNDPEKGCFAERYFDKSQDSLKLQWLHQSINNAAELARTRKEREWRRLCTEHENLVREITAMSCMYTSDELNPLHRIHDDVQCTKCFLQRKANRIQMQVYEHPLPSSVVHAKAVVFELGCPKAFTAYRDATWRVLGTLACPKQTEHHEPKMLLRAYSELKAYMNLTNCNFTLASRTKSFLDTHYSRTRFPVDLDKVLLPNGLKFGYYDTLTKVWAVRQTQVPTFAHHCQTMIPANSPFSSFQFSVDGIGPTSYEIIASQTRCPSGLNVHEFMAYQALFSGKNRRWATLLVELGSTNLNFSTEATTLLISQLAVQAGPGCEDHLRVIHGIFRDESFCERLLEQLAQRLDGISSNWRETYCMEMLVTLILRLWSIASKPGIISQASKLLEKSRKIIFQWINVLRFEIHRATSTSISQRCSRYIFWAALICRRTFAIHVEDDQILQPVALRCFIECSIALQDNLVGDPDRLSPFLRNALIRDLKMVYLMRFFLRRSLEANPDSLTIAVNAVWSEPEGASRTLSAMKFLPQPNEWWIQTTVNATHHTGQQIVHYHLLEGYLFVDRQPLGKLPAEHRESVVLTQLFGAQNLLTYPSALSGMTYMLAFPICRHQIHIGFRKNKLIVRAHFRGSLLELIPPQTFTGPSSFDLPASLIDDCVHWLNIRTGLMEIRKQPNIWKLKSSDWVLDFNARRADRRKVSLVDPQSKLFHQVARIFDRFEYRQQLTVYQPTKGKLRVDLLRLELSFFVNTKGLLESAELRSEIDPDQDAGTWYGLNSKLVMRDAVNAAQRSVVVPIGSVTSKRNSFHVAVEIVNNGNYARFTINDILGRLDCPAEPLLVYLRSLLHAYTSFVIPDRLTGRTGCEEALHYLKSGVSQPWQPINVSHLGKLRQIAALTPRRSFYPEGLKVMQKVFWDSQLTISIQHDQFGPLVEAILKKSEQLSKFSFQKLELPSVESAGEIHLQRRSLARRQLYQRPNPNSEEMQTCLDLPYESRDRCPFSQERKNVFESSALLFNWPSEMATTRDLAGILQSWPIMQGYDRPFDKFLLSDHLAVDFAHEWGSLVKFCRESESRDKYQLMFLFAVMSFRDNVDMDAVRTLIAFCIWEDLKILSPPKWPAYIHFRPNQIPKIDYLLQLIKPYRRPYASDEQSTSLYMLSAQLRKKYAKAVLVHERQTEDDCKIFAQFLLNQWPCLEPRIEGFSIPVLVDIDLALAVVLPEWQRLYQNLELSRHIQQVQDVLDCHRVERNVELRNTGIEDQDVLPIRCHGGELPGLSPNFVCKAGLRLSEELCSILSNKDKIRITDQSNDNALAQAQNEGLPHLLQKPVPPKFAMSHEMQELESIIRGIIGCQSPVRQHYQEDMMQSLTNLNMLKNAPNCNEERVHVSNISVEILKARQAIKKQYDRLCEAFERSDSRVRWLQAGGLWPCITPITLLEQLRSITTSTFGEYIKENLVVYALFITALQRLMRMKDAYQKQNIQRLREEQENAGHGNWQPLKHPDWLLLEIDANILIRHDQVEVAQATISPGSGSNSVLQMNMGKGKTSCIMPMVAAVLADQKKLLRVIVPKPLLLQTAQLLHARLGGLLGREVRHVPFSRKTSTDLETIQTFHILHREILKSSGVILALPEHILSFMLSGLQRLSDGRISQASQMVKIQSWMKRVSRDVLDECDYTLAVRTQLIYPSGSQTTVDGHPHRWETAEALLRLVEGHLWNLQTDFRHSIEVVQRPRGGFPVAFFLRKDVEDALIARLVDDICSGRTSIVLTRDCTKAERLAIKQFITDAKVGPRYIAQISQMFADKPAMKQNVYLLRGLLVHRILLLTLKKRWNVQYGLHPHRDPIAVPFHAKGVPSEQAEWGHPDVAILFTCLSFYYNGLGIPQLRQSLEHVLKSDDPSNEYDRWTHSSRSLPDALREWNAINVDDETQLSEIWQHVRYNMTIVDYFLNNFVFPKHAKQFRMKLQASGWDIPLFSPDGPPSTSKRIGKGSQALTTGFSGTNDNRTMLPLTIKQEDLPGLAHTNAEVLTYLLQKRNREYVLAADSNDRHLSEFDLLIKISSMGIRVLIDVGAQILEMDNLSLVKAWLSVDREPKAAVYFDAENKPFVHYRRGHGMPLVASPYADDLSDCLVYLDEAHTRGTDLKMPAYARGALTLGLGQTKDHTVQAAMRLRQLATTQSVVFFAPPEVHQCILDLRKKINDDPIDSHDVICWLLEQTCSGIEQLQPLYYSQGVEFCRRTQAASDNTDFLCNSSQREAYLNALRQTEHQTLKQFYEPRPKPKPAIAQGTLSPQIAGFSKELNNRRRGFQDTGNAVHGSALQEVEQEREVAFEVEAIREVQKPVHYSPLSFSGLHRDIVRFVKTGRLAADSEACEPASVLMGRTALGLKYGIRNEATTSKLYVSAEFTRTVSLPRGRPNDNFQRQVSWILWSLNTETALIVTPEESECLIPLVRKVREAFTYLLTYAAPVTRKMLHFNDLRYYAIPNLPAGWQTPTWLKIELGIFAGRLYFEYNEYRELCEYLGFGRGTAKLAETIDDTAASAEPYETEEAVDNAAAEANTETGSQQARCFTKRPLSFLQEWLAVRRKGQDFTHTPMGHVCQGKPLTASHPFFTTRGNDGALNPDGAASRRDLGQGIRGDRLSSLDEGSTFGDEDSDDDDEYDDGEDHTGAFENGKSVLDDGTDHL
ncbi:hypothetical protein MMC07_002117 [Pseudocyphellaria aurata]|nr:hypothetical protein [Pseudocyphellaria aurata]